MSNGILLNVSGDLDRGQTRTYVHLNPNASPRGSFTLDVTTTYNKAKDPNAHQKKFSLFLADADAVNALGDFLKASAS